MFDHLNFRVSNISASKAFYTAILTPLGHQILVERHDSGVAGYGSSSVKLWVRPATAEKPAAGPLHFALEAKERAEVDAFHAAGLKAGGKSNGEPGERTYAPFVYAAFLIDPDGNNIECVCRKPPA